MSSARAEARRKAILGRGTDRLARLATSARGDEATSYLQPEVPARAASEPSRVETDDKPLPSAPLPTAVRRTSPSPDRWTEEHQRRFMQTLTGTSPGPLPFVQSPPPDNDPFSAMMAQMAQANQGPAGKASAAAAAPAPSSPLAKFMSLLHLLCMWCLLAYFILCKEPQAFAENAVAAVDVPVWRRWQALLYRRPDETTVHLVPFFWTFMTLQITLHSLRIFGGHSQVKPPQLLAVAVSHLPSPFPSLIMNGLRYLQLGGVFLDDVAAVVFGIGVVVLIASWF